MGPILGMTECSLICGFGSVGAFYARKRAMKFINNWLHTYGEKPKTIIPEEDINMESAASTFS